MKNIIFLFIFTLSFACCSAQQTPSADAVLKEAFAQAAKEKKNVIVMFHASWCGWCHKMDSSLADPSVKDYFNKNYVITHLTILEFDKKNLENPGALELYEKQGGKNQGIPFWLVYDKNGKLLADSQITPGNNSGCPARKEEVDYFITVLKMTSPITDAQAASVEKRFRMNEN